MIYCSVDIETTGLDPEKNQVLSIGAIIEDTEKKLPFHEIPRFNVILLHNELTGHPRAITMNQKIISLMDSYLSGDDKSRKELDEISPYKFINPDEAAKKFFFFLQDNGVLNPKTGYISKVDSNTKTIIINVAGKNFGTFDKLFLERLPWWKKLIQVRQRIIDPSTLYCDWNNDVSLPSLYDCKIRLGGVIPEVSHDAIEDAWDVITLLRKFY